MSFKNGFIKKESINGASFALSFVQGTILPVPHVFLEHKQRQAPLWSKIDCKDIAASSASNFAASKLSW